MVIIIFDENRENVVRSEYTDASYVLVGAYLKWSTYVIWNEIYYYFFSFSFLYHVHVPTRNRIEFVNQHQAYARIHT